MTAIPYRRDPHRWAFQLRRATEHRARLLVKMDRYPDRRADYMPRLRALEQDIANYSRALGLPYLVEPPAPPPATPAPPSAPATPARRRRS